MVVYYQKIVAKPRRLKVLSGTVPFIRPHGKMSHAQFVIQGTPRISNMSRELGYSKLVYSSVLATWRALAVILAG
jgi:hypothetical protein